MAKDMVELWKKWTDEDGKDHFEKVNEFKDEHCSFSLDDEIDEENRISDEEIDLEYEGYLQWLEEHGDEVKIEEVTALCGKTLREKFYLLGMVAAYENVLGIEDDDEE